MSYVYKFRYNNPTFTQIHQMNTKDVNFAERCMIADFSLIFTDEVERVDEAMRLMKETGSSCKIKILGKEYIITSTFNIDDAISETYQNKSFLSALSDSLLDDINDVSGVIFL